MKKRGSLFYIIDAFIASAIITLTLVVIISSYNTQSSPDVAYNSLDNYISFFESVEIRNAPGIAAQDLLKKKIIKNPQEKIIDAIIELYAQGNTTAATNLIANISAIILEPQFGINFNITNGSQKTRIFQSNIARLADSNVVLNKQITTHVLREGSIQYTDITSITTAGLIECINAGNQECLFVELECTSPPAPPTSKIVPTWPGCLYKIGTFNEPAGCSVNRTRCAKPVPAAIYGPYTVEVTLWV